VLLGLMPSCKRAVEHPGALHPAAAKPNFVPAPASQLPPACVSVFEEMMPPKGRDPFFPNSRRREPAAHETPPRDKPVAAELALKGIVGSPSHRLAVINSAILELNEEAMVRLPDGGRARVRCVEIGQDYAVIKVEGEPQPKRLELNRKGF
jgi:hypothetical protein